MVDIFSPNFEFEMPKSLYLELLERDWFEDLAKEAIGVWPGKPALSSNHNRFIISWGMHDEFVKHCKRTWLLACRKENYGEGMLPTKSELEFLHDYGVWIYNHMNYSAWLRKDLSWQEQGYYDDMQKLEEAKRNEICD